MGLLGVPMGHHAIDEAGNVIMVQVTSRQHKSIIAMVCVLRIYRELWDTGEGIYGVLCGSAGCLHGSVGCHGGMCGSTGYLTVAVGLYGVSMGGYGPLEGVQGSL